MTEYPPVSAAVRKSPVRILAVLLSLSLLVSVLMPRLNVALAQSEARRRRTVSVSGEGIVRVQPDMAAVNFGVVTTADDPEEARRLNAEAAKAALNAVRALGVEARNIRLDMLRLQPNRVYDDDLRRYVEKGFEATRQVVVEVHDLEKLPTLIAEIVQQGANRVNQVSYELKDRDRVRNDALREAVTNAREKAQLIIETLGENLGEVVQVDEQSFDFPRPVVRMEAMEMRASKTQAAPEPEAYAAGEIEVRASVHAVFALQD